MNAKRTALILLFLLVLVPARAKLVKGSVNGPDAPLAGVVVSDGYRFAKTDKNGKFSINTHKDARFVFVITPSGYTGDFSQGDVKFYLPIKGTKKFDFQLQKMMVGDDYTLFSVSDPQMQTEEHLALFSGRPLGDLRGMAKKYGSQRQTVGIVLGDIAWNKPFIFEPYKQTIAKTGIPFYGVIGNHDFIQPLSGIAAGEAFESAFGPYNYAFFLGKDLVIAVNNLIFVGSGLEVPDQSSKNYKEGYSQETLDFVKGLLAFVGKDTHLFLAQHSPIMTRKNGKIENADQLLQLLDGYEVDILAGHSHCMNRHRVSETVYEYNAAAIGGAWWATTWCKDGTPRGYDIISNVAGERTYAWHNLDYPDDFQVEFINIGQAPLHRNSVVANAWCADDTWTCTWTQDGKEMGAAKLKKEESPTYTREIVAYYDNDPKKVQKFRRPVANHHSFVATPSQYASKVTMTVTAPDGRSWSHEFDLRGAYIDLQAHRGGAGLRPENTFSSMEKAIELNVNTLEFDLQLSGDGKVVVSHDRYFHPRYSTRPDGSLVQKEDPKEYLYTMPYDSIAKYDVGLRPNEVWPDQKKMAQVKPLASELIDFAEELSRKKGHSPVRYNIEIKSIKGKGEGKNWPKYKEFCKVCMEMLKEKKLGKRLTVQSFDTRSLEYIHKHYPKVALSYLTEKDETEIATILSQLSFTPCWWSPHYSVVTPENVAYCHALGIRVVPWTVDKPEDILRMKECGVDAIISNYPDRLVKLLRDTDQGAVGASPASSEK